MRIHMALVELCLLSLLSPQEPAPTTAPTPPAMATATPADGDDERTRLLAAERAGAAAGVEELAALTQASEPAVAARATWLLGRLEGPAAGERLREAATTSPHAEARRQALHALLQKPQVTAFATGVTALGDDDLEVRTLAAQLLGKLRRPAAVTPLMALVEHGPRTTDRAATDLQAALCALHDLGAKEHLLRLATALHDRPAKDVGQALAWCFQQLSPQLDATAQTTLLVAVLDHRESLLRRYAIGRLGELAVPTTASALERRLANETAELRPLVEVALAQVRGLDTPPPTDELERALANARGLAAAARARWERMPPQDRLVAGAVAGAVLLLLVVIARQLRRRAHAAAAAATAALVAPSEEHLEELAAEAEAMAAAAEAEYYEDQDGGDVAEDGEPAEAVETDGWGEPIDAATAAEEADLGRR
ncbi:MAG: HEAT repeat domain-containing protein [Planctomycetes bacterium]|nr:HEAT repeat domain-containing protein [Planctomycetota bacterium]